MVFFTVKVKRDLWLPLELYQKPTFRTGALTTYENPKNILSQIPSHTTWAIQKVRRKFPHLTCKLVSCCCWWAMVCFTKTLLMLCSIAYFFAWGARKGYELLMVDQHYLVHISFLPGADLPVAMLPAALGWEAEGQAWSPCSVHSPSSELHLPGIHKPQFNPTLKSKSENGAWSVKAPAWIICRSKQENPSVETHHTTDQYAAMYCM